MVYKNIGETKKKLISSNHSSEKSVNFPLKRKDINPYVSGLFGSPKFVFISKIDIAEFQNVSKKTELWILLISSDLVSYPIHFTSIIVIVFIATFNAMTIIGIKTLKTLIINVKLI